MFILMYRNVMSIDTLNSPLFPSSTSAYLYRNVVCAGVVVLLLLPGSIFLNRKVAVVPKNFKNQGQQNGPNKHSRPAHVL